MTYQEALKYLGSFINYEKKDKYDYKSSFRLDRIKKIASLLGNPQEGIKSIHVAGTKGKGSTAAIIHSILKSAGFRVGLYTSPHLISFRERIRIGDLFIEESDICDLLERIKSVIGLLPGEKPSFFEVYTTLAYSYFKNKKVDFAVYETGLGGRLDATNIINPLVSVITPISYEHTDKLGSTLKEIACEKGGIIKNKGICVAAPQEKEALEELEKICRQRDAKMILAGRDVLFEEIASDDKKEVFNVFGLFGEYPILEMSLLGSHQVVNAATSIAAIEALRFHDIAVPEYAVRAGMASVRWDGRIEIAGRSPLVILDGAQNKASARALAAAIKKSFRYKNLILVLGVSRDKDVSGILEELMPICDSAIFTKSKVTERALEPSIIEQHIRDGRCGILLTENVSEALTKAKSIASSDDLILVTGSLFVVGEAKEITSGCRV